MDLLHSFWTALTTWSRRQSVRTHTRNQAHGPRWSQHRRRRIQEYTRKRCRRNRL